MQTQEVRLLGAARGRAGGVCPTGCWPERGPDGNIICVCDYGVRRLAGDGEKSLTENAIGIALGAVILLGIIGFVGHREGQRTDAEREAKKRIGVFRGVGKSWRRLTRKLRA